MASVSPRKGRRLRIDFRSLPEVPPDLIKREYLLEPPAHVVTVAVLVIGVFGRSEFQGSTERGTEAFAFKTNRIGGSSGTLTFHENYQWSRGLNQ